MDYKLKITTHQEHSTGLARRSPYHIACHRPNMGFGIMYLIWKCRIRPNSTLLRHNIVHMEPIGLLETAAKTQIVSVLPVAFTLIEKYGNTLITL